MSIDGRKWDGISFEEAEMENLRAGCRMSFREKLQWLEQAEQTADAFARARVRVRNTDGVGWAIFHDRKDYLRERRSASP
jgi:hypothetical protein